MAADRTTETIFHFIGHWELILESLRQRIEYDEFKAEEAEKQDAALLELGAAHIRVPFKIKDYDPELDYTPSPSPSMAGDTFTEALPFIPEGMPVPQSFSPPEDVPEHWMNAPSPNFIILPYVPIPSSVAVVSVQVISLYDADSVGLDMSGFVDPAVFEAELREVAAFAETLAGPGGGQYEAIAAISPDFVQDFVITVREFEAPVYEGLSTAIHTDDEMTGAFVNGEAAEELPEFEDVLPEAIREKRGLNAEDEEDGAGDGEASSDENTPAGEASAEDIPAYKLNPVLDKDATEEENLYGVDPGQRFVTGMNDSSNTVKLTTSMIDASVIVVAGNVNKLISVSQVNVASNRDIGSTVSETGITALNLAEFRVLPDGLPEDGEGAAPEDSGSGAGVGETPDSTGTATSETVSGPEDDCGPMCSEESLGQPTGESMSVSGTEAVVTQNTPTNESPQSNSKAENEDSGGPKAAEASGQGSAPGMSGQSSNPVSKETSQGKNTVAQANDGAANPSKGSKAPENDDAGGEPEDLPAEEALPYAGLPQTWNIEIFEGDVVQLNSFTQVSFALDTDRVDFTITADATYLSTGENILFNSMDALEIGFGYDLIFIGGDLIDMTIVSQTNVLLDDDTVSIEGDVTVSGGDNLLLNYVSITQYGEDSFEEIEDNFENAVDNLENDIEELDAAVAQDELFTGVEALRALYISGDLVKVTAVSQTNIMGDQDQVSLALDAFSNDARGAIDVVTGSNALSNSAEIEDLGFDSVIMAQGEVYDDALLYTAELIDTDAAPTGVDLTQLANEAVAFLADDMLLPELPEDGPIAAPDMQNDTGDVLQTLLT